MPIIRRVVLAGLALVGSLTALAVPVTVHAPRASAAIAPTLHWTDCSQASGFQCATFGVPRDYARRAAGTFSLAVTRLPARDPAHRVGSLFVNFGGPGGPNVRTLQANGRRLLAGLNQRFDLVAFDPRGTGASTPTIDCAVDQEQDGPFAQPFPTPSTVDSKRMAEHDRRYLRRCRERNPGVLPYVSTANVARDMDRLRRAVGDRQLSYLGLSYGTFLGATYASLFPHSYRALALEGALEPDQYVNHPLQLRSSLAAAQERSVGRFLQWCAAGGHFGGAEPQSELDALIARLADHPLSVGKRTVDGDDVLVALGSGLHKRDSWPALATALTAAQHGDGTAVRQLADGFYDRQVDGHYRPTLDAFFAVSAVDQRNPTGLAPYRRAGESAWNDFDHGYFLAGYGQSTWGADAVRPHGVFRGPFRAATDAPTVLVIGTTYDPATPYKAAQQMTRELGNARLLTMDGDGHGAYGGESPCIDSAVDGYLLEQRLPAAGTRCPQQPR